MPRTAGNSGRIGMVTVGPSEWENRDGDSGWENRDGDSGWENRDGASGSK